MILLPSLLRDYRCVTAFQVYVVLRMVLGKLYVLGKCCANRLHLQLRTVPLMEDFQDLCLTAREGGQELYPHLTNKDAEAHEEKHDIYRDPKLELPPCPFACVWGWRGRPLPQLTP